MNNGIDYTIFDKEYFSVQDLLSQEPFDIFISSYNNSDRVTTVFDKLNAKKKIWVVLPEYDFRDDEIPRGNNVFYNNTLVFENEYILQFFEEFKIVNELKNGKACIDLTGFSRAHVVFFFRYLREIGIRKISAIYTDPLAYIKNERTAFSIGHIDKPRQISLCEGLHNSDTSNDYLIIGSGYDYKLISYVASSKEKAKKIQVFGFPSLKPHMYQENILQAIRAREAIGGHNFIHDRNTLFAPANDPFVTAQVLKEFIDRVNQREIITNLYLSPLSTKAQTLGFILYYIWECIDKPVSIILPVISKYSRETTKGISKIWRYQVFLPPE
ncbi:MAG: hypothetical protein A2V66_06050 [Ignavibacteria bacterium RBG_13_36_8]|nr:MAG: hypothetical protein A2V66_06050 [Ignavibacteria bacterium RBG_13_36_8]